MKTRTLIIIAAILAAFILVPGCTKPAIPSPAPVTQAPAAPEETTATSATRDCSLTPGPTQEPPAYESVSFSVDRNTVATDPSITTSFNGGQGLGMIQSMTVTVIRSDCIREQETRKKPGIGTSITQAGTTKTDRVIVSVVMTSGDQYTVIDNAYPFQGPRV